MRNNKDENGKLLPCHLSSLGIDSNDRSTLSSYRLRDLLELLDSRHGQLIGVFRDWDEGVERFGVHLNADLISIRRKIRAQEDDLSDLVRHCREHYLRISVQHLLESF
ncbi:MAG: hypothetical protein Q9219_004508 [cf. Caloplaca sp. 3 TL-2023]